MNAKKTEISLLHKKITISDTMDNKRASSGSTNQSAKINNHQVINDFLSSIDASTQMDKFGIAFLPMDKLQQRNVGSCKKIRLLMVIEAPPAKDTFQLYTHFNGSIGKCCSTPAFEDKQKNGTTSENRVLNNLLLHGKHKALSLRQVCDDRMRFSFEGKKSELRSESKVKNILDMFVKVSIKMKKTIER